MRDGKDKFYRTLNLDKETRKLIRGFRHWKQKAMNDRLEEGESVYDNIRRQYNPKRRRPEKDSLERDSREQEDKEHRDSSDDASSDS